MQPKILDMVRQHLAKMSDAKVNPEDIFSHTRLKEDLHLDSLTALTVIMDLEEKYKVHIEDCEIASLKTVGDAVQLIESKNPKLE